MPDRAVVVEISRQNAEHLATIVELMLDEGGALPADARLLETLAFDLRCKLDDPQPRATTEQLRAQEVGE